MAMASSLIVLARALKWALNAVRAAGKLHDDLLDTVMRLPMSFFGAIERAHRTQPPIEDRLCFDHLVLPCFLTNVLWSSLVASDTTPTGRIITRFARDVDQIDTQVSGQVSPDHPSIIYSTFFVTSDRLSND